MSESCHTWMSHVTHEWVMSHMNESCHTWMSRVAHMNESHYKQMMHHGTHLNELWHTHEWVMSHTWMSHLIFESWHTNEWVMAHTWTSHSVHMNESFDWATRSIEIALGRIHKDSKRDPQKRPTLIHSLVECNFQIALKRIHMCVPWLICMCPVTHSNMCHDSFMCVPRLAWSV